VVVRIEKSLIYTVRKMGYLHVNIPSATYLETINNFGRQKSGFRNFRESTLL